MHAIATERARVAGSAHRHKPLTSSFLCCASRVNANEKSITCTWILGTIHVKCTPKLKMSSHDTQIVCVLCVVVHGSEVCTCLCYWPSQDSEVMIRSQAVCLFACYHCHSSCATVSEMFCRLWCAWSSRNVQSIRALPQFDWKKTIMDFVCSTGFQRTWRH